MRVKVIIELRTGTGVIALGKDEDTCKYHVTAGGETIRELTVNKYNNDDAIGQGNYEIGKWMSVDAHAHANLVDGNPSLRTNSENRCEKKIRIFLQHSAREVQGKPGNALMCSLNNTIQYNKETRQ